MASETTRTLMPNASSNRIASPRSILPSRREVEAGSVGGMAEESILYGISVDDQNPPSSLGEGLREEIARDRLAFPPVSRGQKQ